MQILYYIGNQFVIKFLFFLRQSLPYATRNKGYGGGVRTAAQAAVKSVFKQLSQSWKSLTNEQILAWNSLALSQAGRSVLGTSSKITGSNLYMRLNYWIVTCGGGIFSFQIFQQKNIPTSKESLSLQDVCGFSPTEIRPL